MRLLNDILRLKFGSIVGFTAIACQSEANELTLCRFRESGSMVDLDSACREGGGLFINYILDAS